MVKGSAVKIGLFSRIDAGSPGYRRGLVKKGFEIFHEEGTHFNILLGGLVSKRAIARFLKNKIQAIKDEAKRIAQESGEKPKKINKAQIEEEYLSSLAKELAEALPKFPKINDGKKLPRLYIMTSPSYDGAYGERIAKKLTELRPDIRYWEKTDEHFPLKGMEKYFLGLVPDKESWASEYDSTPVDRLVKDHQRRTTKSLPDIYGIGCFASSFYKPRGEAKRPYLSVPALHKLEEVRTSENQIGVVVLEISSDSERKRTYNLKDFLGKERESIPIPPHCSSAQKAILGALKEKGAITIGLLSDSTGLPRDTLAPVLKRMLDSERFQPKIHYDKASGRYDFDLEWIQQNIVYDNNFSKKDWQEDALLGFGCLHAGSVHTDYKFFVDRLPEVILKNGIKVFAGDGDLIEGLKHHLIERGEVFGGFDYTAQEKLAAHLISEVMTRVFEARFLHSCKDHPSEQELEALVSDSLLTFIYREGNHDDWMQDIGVAPLTIFRYELVNCLNKAVADILKSKGCFLPELNKIIENKVRKTEVYVLASGISLEMFHLHMARAKTTTLRLQETFSKSGCHIVFLANFHVATSMERWDPELGQRVGMQFGTIVRETQFEENKGKKVDTGVGCLIIFSKNKKIMMSEEFFVIPPDGESLNNSEILKSLEKRIGIRHG